MMQLPSLPSSILLLLSVLLCSQLCQAFLVVGITDQAQVVSFDSSDPSKIINRYPPFIFSLIRIYSPFNLSLGILQSPWFSASPNPRPLYLLLYHLLLLSSRNYLPMKIIYTSCTLSHTSASYLSRNLHNPLHYTSEMWP